jgi:large subunit ribosomal protein L5
VTSRLKEKYHKEVIPELIKKFSYKNVWQAPRLEKIVVNVGIGKLREDAKLVEKIVNDISLITGQKTILTKARKSIAAFKLRKGVEVGCKVTLRRENMYIFLDKLISITLPRIRDFRGVSANSFDDHGNYTLGLKEQTIFSEIEYDKAIKVYGMNITLAINGRKKEENREFLRLMGMPFSK